VGFAGSNEGFAFLPTPSGVVRPGPHGTAPHLRRLAGAAVPRGRARPAGLRALQAGPQGGDLNQLQTALISAIEAEDYSAAAKYRDLIKAATQEQGGGRSPSWTALQVPEWLADRAERLGFRVPAQVQQNALRAVMNQEDTVIRSPTGSGKTLAYLMPLLSLISDELLDDDIMLHLSRFQSKQSTRSQRVSKLVDRELSPTPLAVVVVPTRELGVQVSTLCYMLLGGSRNNPKIMPERIPIQYQPGSKTNMFSYKGPRRVKVVGVWDDEALNTSMPVEDFGLDALKGAHILVTTPKYLRPISERGHVPLGNARVVVVDEADACLAGEDGSALQAIFSKNFATKNALDGSARVRIFAGASLLRAQVDTAAEQNFLQAPTAVDDQVAGTSSAKIWEAGQRVPSSIKHQYVVCSDKTRALGLLAKLVRSEITRWQGIGRQPRMIVYAGDATTAQKVASPLQNSLWTGLGGDADAGLWGLSVLLPSAEDSCQFAAGLSLSLSAHARTHACPHVRPSARCMHALAQSARMLTYIYIHTHTHTHTYT